MPNVPADFTSLLVDLASSKIDFIVVGGVAAFLQGAPVYTVDLDLVHARNQANIERLTRVLMQHRSFYREHPDRKPPPDPVLLKGEGHHLFDTDVGPVDVLGVIGEGESFQELLPASTEVTIEPGVPVRVLTLEKIIVLKKQLNREKDRGMLEVLQRTLAERSRDASSD